MLKWQPCLVAPMILTTLGWLSLVIMMISSVMVSTTLSCSERELRQNETWNHMVYSMAGTIQNKSVIRATLDVFDKHECPPIPIFLVNGWIYERHLQSGYHFANHTTLQIILNASIIVTSWKQSLVRFFSFVLYTRWKSVIHWNAWNPSQQSIQRDVICVQQLTVSWIWC